MKLVGNVSQSIEHEVTEVADGFKYDSLSKKRDALNFEQLKDMDKTRRALLGNERTFSRFKIFTSFAGTVMPRLIFSRQVWSTYILYIILRVLMQLRIINFRIFLSRLFPESSLFSFYAAI